MPLDIEPNFEEKTLTFTITKPIPDVMNQDTLDFQTNMLETMAIHVRENFEFGDFYKIQDGLESITKYIKEIKPNLENEIKKSKEK